MAGCGLGCIVWVVMLVMVRSNGVGVWCRVCCFADCTKCCCVNEMRAGTAEERENGGTHGPPAATERTTWNNRAVTASEPPNPVLAVLAVLAAPPTTQVCWRMEFDRTLENLPFSRLDLPSKGEAKTIQNLLDYKTTLPPSLKRLSLLLHQRLTNLPPPDFFKFFFFLFSYPATLLNTQKPCLLWA